MPFLRVIKEALASISANKTRSFLTVLGIIIGVGAVIGFLSIGEGAQSSILGQIESIGTNVINVMQYSDGENVTSPKPLTIADAEALTNRSRAPHIQRVAPVLMEQVTFTLADASEKNMLYGSYSEYGDITGLEIEEGANFSPSDVESRAAVVVLGPEMAERLTGKRSGVVGTMIRINDFPYRVIGVTKAKGATQFNNPDLMAYMPITTMQLRISRQSATGSVQYIILQAKDSQSIKAAIEEAQAILRDSHRLNPRQGNDFTLTNQEDILSIANSITNIFTIF